MAYSLNLLKPALGWSRYQVKSVRFNVHIQSKLLWHTPVMGTHSGYQLGCLSRTVVSSNSVRCY